MTELFSIEPAGERKCAGCGVVRPLALFYVAAEERAAANLGIARLRRVCRICQREKNYQRLGPRYELIAKIKVEAGCADCGIKDPEHPEIYDFDHRPGVEKVATVAALLTKGTVEDMLAEAAKCDVVCANCHRIRTHSKREPRAFGKDRGAETSRRYPNG